MGKSRSKTRSQVTIPKQERLVDPSIMAELQDLRVAAIRRRRRDDCLAKVFGVAALAAAPTYVMAVSDAIQYGLHFSSGALIVLCAAFGTMYVAAFVHGVLRSGDDEELWDFRAAARMSAAAGAITAGVACIGPTAALGYHVGSLVGLVVPFGLATTVAVSITVLVEKFHADTATLRDPAVVHLRPEDVETCDCGAPVVLTSAMYAFGAVIVGSIIRKQVRRRARAARDQAGM